MARLDLGQSEPLAEYYRETFERTGVPEGKRDPAVLLAGVIDESRRRPALEWLRAVEPQVDPAFAITHYALLGDADAAYRIASTYNLADDFWYLYQRSPTSGRRAQRVCGATRAAENCWRVGAMTITGGGLGSRSCARSRAAA